MPKMCPRCSVEKPWFALYKQAGAHRVAEGLQGLLHGRAASRLAMEPSVQERRREILERWRDEGLSFPTLALRRSPLRLLRGSWPRDSAAGREDPVG
jgi:hypothetical protein